MAEKNDIKIIIDSREKIPYRFKNSQTGILNVGDYSIVGLEDQISIERKELNDLIGCLTTGRERFEKELFKGKALDYFCIVVEGKLLDIINGNYRSQMEPKSAIQSLLAFSVRYRLPIFFCENRQYAERVTESLLEKYAVEVERRFKELSSK